MRNVWKGLMLGAVTGAAIGLTMDSGRQAGAAPPSWRTPPGGPYASTDPRWERSSPLRHRGARNSCGTLTCRAKRATWAHGSVTPPSATPPRRSRAGACSGA